MNVKFDCPNCRNENISLLIGDGNIVVKDRENLTSYLYDHIDVNDIFFAEELIDEILNVLSNTEIREINLHKILVDNFITANCCSPVI